MPPSDVRSKITRIHSLSQIQKFKKRWGVSLAALTYHLSKLKIISEWQARNYFIQMNKDGSRVTEPDPMPFETSSIWQTVFRELWNDRITKAHIASDLGLPEDEFESLVFGLAAQAFDPMAKAENLSTHHLNLAVNNDKNA